MTAPRAASWAFHEEDSVRIRSVLTDFLRDASARTALLVDRAGQMLIAVGEPPSFDPTAFASLTAADFRPMTSSPGCWARAISGRSFTKASASRSISRTSRVA
jgi:hypothetical protein